MRLFLLLYFLLITLSLDGQAYFFRQHALPENWKQEQPQLIYQDRDGYIWLGTQSGLFLFDGLEFSFLPRPDQEKLEATSIYQDKQGRHWVGYRDGAIYTVDKLDGLLPLNMEEGHPAVPISGFAEDDKGQLWMATYGEGVYVLQEERMYNFNTSDGLPAEDIYCITADFHGGIWLGSDNGLSRCTFVEQKKEVRNFSTRDGLPDIILKDLHTDAEGTIWIGTHDGGFCRFDPQARTFQHFGGEWMGGPISTLQATAQDVWIGTENKGLFRYSRHQNRLFKVAFPDHRRYNKIYDLQIDEEANLWLASNRPTLISTHLQFSFSLGPGHHIQSLRCTQDQRYWVGTAQGLFEYLPERNTYHRRLPNWELNIISLYEDPWGRLWIGTFGQGVLCYDPDSGNSRWLNKQEGLYNESVLSIDGNEEKVWLATLGGITEWTISEDLLKEGPVQTLNYQQESGLGTNYVYKVFVDSKGDPWFGTDGKGLSLLRHGKISNFSSVLIKEEKDSFDTLPLRTIYSITEDKQGNIWFSTADNGIFKYDGSRFSHVNLKDGIRDLTITSMTCNQLGQIVLVHASGIDLLDPRTGQLTYYGQEAGINTLEPNLNAVCMDLYGRTLIAGQQQIVWHLPQTSVRRKPTIHIRQVMNLWKPIELTPQGELAHHQHNLIFQFSGLWYTHPQAVVYRYKLEGYNHDWIVTKDEKAVYSNLPPGDYTFHVAATIDQFSGGEEEARLSFSISPPFWTRWWFIGLIITGLTGIGYAIVKIRDRRLHRMNLLEKEKVESQFEALKSQINPHFLFNNFNTLIAIIEEDPELAVRFTEKLSDFYRSILLHRQKSIISLQEEMELVRTYVYLIKQRFGDKLQLETRVLPNGFYIAPLTLQMLVENAIKHNIISSTRPLKISILQSDEDQEIRVINNYQKKLKTSESTGFGLQNIVSRYALLSDRKVRIENKNGNFQVAIPLLKKMSS